MDKQKSIVSVAPSASPVGESTEEREARLIEEAIQGIAGDTTVKADETPGAIIWDGMSEPDDYETYEPTPADVEQAAAVEETRGEMGGQGPDADLPEGVRKRFASIDWEAAYKTDFSKVDWLPGRFMERGQQVTLVGDGKVGKSLFALDWAYRCASGRRFMNDVRHEPLRVLYLDRENSLRDVITRAQALGAAPNDLANVVYKQFPQFKAGLDQAAGAAGELVRLAEIHRADIVIIDTVSRFITGKENDSDTWLQLYQLMHARLKHLGIACLRLDHFGKDADRGSRGSSAKSQDVDAVWELSASAPEKSVEDDVETIKILLKMRRTHTRSGLGEDLFPMSRVGQRQRGGMWMTNRTRHELVGAAALASVKQDVDEIVQRLIDGKCPAGGREAVRAWMKANYISVPRSDTLAEVVRAFKDRQPEMTDSK